MDEARLLADALFYSDPYRVKRYHNVWGKADAPTISLGNFILNEDAGYFVLERVPEYMELSEQLELAAQTLCQQNLFEFLLRPATREGEVSQSVVPISIADYLRDTENGELQFPDQQLVNTYRTGLAARSGMPVATILADQEQRLTGGTTREQQQEPIRLVRKAASLATPDGAESNGSKPFIEQQPVRQENAAYPELHTERDTYSRLTLDEDQLELLTYLMEHPESPVNVVYKEVGVRAARITTMRDELKAQGLLQELAVRSTSPSGGRPTKILIPTLQAFTLLGKEPPVGRGGAIHRYVQQMIVQGATNKGYSATVEKAVGNGAIVDVHLQKEERRIAVEIAVVSTPEREISHIRNCLSVGYMQVVTLFADDTLLQRTATSMQAAFSPVEAGKVRLLPLGKLSQVG
jgi:hypothetical protein